MYNILLSASFFILMDMFGRLIRQMSECSEVVVQMEVIHIISIHGISCNINKNHNFDA